MYWEQDYVNASRDKNTYSLTGWARLIRSQSSARFCFELSGNSNLTKACNSNFGQNFELEITLDYFFELELSLI